MPFCWSTLLVKDMKESLEFYQDIINLNISEEFITPDGKEIIFMGDGETKIELIYDENNSDINIGNGISWGFKVDSLEEKMNLIKDKGIEIESGPFQPNPYLKFFYILDPNGLKIQLVEELK